MPTILLNAEPQAIYIRVLYSHRHHSPKITDLNQTWIVQVPSTRNHKHQWAFIAILWTYQLRNAHKTTHALLHYLFIHYICCFCEWFKGEIIFTSYYIFVSIKRKHNCEHECLCPCCIQLPQGALKPLDYLYPSIPFGKYISHFFLLREIFEKLVIKDGVNKSSHHGKYFASLHT